MLNWIHNPHAGFVIAAYGAAFAALIGFGLALWCAYRKQNKEWRDLGRNS